MQRLEDLKRVFALLLLAFWFASPWALSAQAQSPANKSVTLNLNSVTVKDFFAEVKKQTGLNFIYSSDLAKTLPRVTVSANNKPVKEVFDQVMEKLGCNYEIEGNFVTITRKLSGPQTRTVTGHVTDTSGEPLPGVSICIDDSKICTITDSQGFYSLKVPETACSLKFSYVGMTNSVVRIPNGATALHRNVQMIDDNTLDEVVVTGYQSISMPKMTGSVTTISSEQLNERYTTNILDNLEGRVAGLSTYGGELKIRGTSTLYADSNPLLVVDGLPVEGSIDDLNPYDIESVTVLKDAAATAIYGARAGNGIVVVTTKSAKKKGKVDIDFSMNLTVKERTNLDYSDNFYMTAAQQVALEQDYWYYYFFDNDGEISDPISSIYSSIEAGTSYISPIQYAYYQWAQGLMTQEEVEALCAKLSQNNYAKEYGDAVYKTQILQQYNLSLRSRSDRSQNNLTLNYKYDNSGIINAGESHFNINYKGSYDLAKWLTANFSATGIFSNKKEAGYDYNASYTSPWAVPAYESLYNDDGSLKNIYYWYNGNEYWSTASDTNVKDLGSNPLTELYHNTQTTRTQYMKYHADLLFKIIEGLTAETQFVYETSHSTVDWVADAESHAARSMYNAYITYDASTGTYGHLTPTIGGFKNTTNTDTSSWTWRGQVNYAKSFGKHAVNALAGLEFRQTKTNGAVVCNLGYDEQLQSSATTSVDLATLSQISYGSYYMLASGYGYPAYQFVYGPYIEDYIGIIQETEHRYASGYANVTYTYNDRYNLFASYRKDYADVYGLNAKFRGSPLWSVGAAWVATEESFLKPAKWLNFLKVRLSYGVTGNIYQGATSYMTATTGDTNSYTLLPYGEIESPANPNLKWEKTRTVNFGVDFALLDNRLRGTFDYYDKKSNDVFSYKTLDPTTGFTSMFVNMADLYNRGVEVSLSYDWFRARSRKNVSWTTSLTFSHNKNMVTSVENASTMAYQLISNPYVKGYPASAIWSYQFAGISSDEGEEGQTLWYVEDGGTSHSAQSHGVEIMEYSGQTEPKYIMGMDNRVTWNGFSLSILMSYYGGHVMRALTEDETFGVPTTAVPSYFLNAWTPENPTTTPGIGRYGSTSIGSETLYSNQSVYPADFLKIRNIVFGYDLPYGWIQKWGINRLGLRFQIDNPKYLWVKNDIGVDPETLGLRNPTSFIFGININL